jgi:hypothetical protein
MYDVALNLEGPDQRPNLRQSHRRPDQRAPRPYLAPRLSCSRCGCHRYRRGLKLRPSPKVFFRRPDSFNCRRASLNSEL